MRWVTKVDLPHELGPDKISEEPICSVTSHIFIFYKFLCKKVKNNKNNEHFGKTGNSFSF